MMNVGYLNHTSSIDRLLHADIDLAMLILIIIEMSGIHPKALLEFDNQSVDLKHEITDSIANYDDPIYFYTSKLSKGISTIAAALYPAKVIVVLHVI